MFKQGKHSRRYCINSRRNNNKEAGEKINLRVVTPLRELTPFQIALVVLIEFFLFLIIYYYFIKPLTTLEKCCDFCRSSGGKKVSKGENSIRARGYDEIWDELADKLYSFISFPLGFLQVPKITDEATVTTGEPTAIKQSQHTPQPHNLFLRMVVITCLASLGEEKPF